ncbi:quinon protein alcohol dehydrogenase-like superfamily [Blakeslea trispora]|nr:quinon protein alcohol dehydrogenase-like superfamily [Blakeslea trispora]
MNFKARAKAIEFSPDSKFLAITHEKTVNVWRAPGHTREFAPFVLYFTAVGHHDQVTSINWSPDGRYFITASKDMTCRIYSIDKSRDDVTTTLSGHRDYIINAWFSADMKSIYSVSRDGSLFEWKNSTYAGLHEDSDTEMVEVDEDGNEIVRVDKIKWRILKKNYFNTTGVKVTTAEFFSASNLVVVGFTNGIFGIYEVPHFTTIHTLSISQKKIDSVAINKTGEWLAFGSSALGQLLVWEWSSETYVLKQQGHYYDINAISYSADGQSLATAGDDGKVKVWSTTSGFCFVTFSDHTSGVKAVEFAKQGQVVFSASLDGTVRAFDLVRYRNFRTFTSPNPVQFTSLAVDPSGEIVCAGTMDTFEIYVWSVQTGKLLDILAGHTGPISSLAFSPTGMTLVSGSWDHSARTWDVFGRTKSIETLVHQTEVLAVAFKPDGKEVAAATLDGQITFWDIAEANVIGTIDGRKDIMGGRKKDDRISADNAHSGKCFNSLCYTADGTSIIGSGTSKYICIYDVATSFLIKKFTISKNLSLDGTQEMLNSKHITAFGSLEELSDEEGSDLENRQDHALPGTKTGDLSARKARPEVKSMAVRFSPTGRAWAAATTDGLMIYSLDEDILFDPFDLEIDITPETVLEALGDKEYLKSLCMAFRLNEKPLIHTVFEGVPPDSVELVAREMPEKYLFKLLTFVGTHMETSPHIEFHLMWVTHVMTAHGRYLRDHRGQFQPVFRALYKGVHRVRDDIASL